MKKKGKKQHPWEGKHPPSAFSRLKGGKKATPPPRVMRVRNFRRGE